MKKIFLQFLISGLGIFIPIISNGQVPYVKQVITANSGKFEFAPPYQDYVTLQSYVPVSGTGGIIGTVNTQSAQDIVIKGGIAYIAAQDSIIKVSLDTYQRLAAVSDSGLSKLYIFQDKLIVSKQYPLTTYFAEVLDTSDLSLIHSISGIPGDCGNITSYGDSVFIAVNGGWMGTEGKVAVIETTGWTLSRIINFGSVAAGTMSIYTNNDKLFTVNKSSYATPDLGSISSYDLINHSFTNFVLQKNVGSGAGIKDDLLYFGFNYGIGSFNMQTGQISDSSIVEDPGSASFKYITSAKVDVINDWLFVNTGDYQTPGTCLVATLDGDSVTSYATGISSEAIDFDYRTAPAGNENININNSSISIYPNPVTNRLIIASNAANPIEEIRIFNITGRRVSGDYRVGIQERVIIPVENLSPGLYQLVAITNEGSISTRFIKK